MSTLSYLLKSLDEGCFDCIEYGDAGIPGRLEGALRVRRGEDSGTYQLSRITRAGGEESLAPVTSSNLEASVQRFTTEVSQRTGLARFFPLTLRGSLR
jgi:hypothetical protein